MMLLFLFFSLSFFIVKDIYDTRNPETPHKEIFTNTNSYPSNYKLLIPSIVEVTRITFSYLHFDYFTSIQRLYKVYNLFAITITFYFYYLFLNKFFKKTASLMMSILLLLLFFIGLKVGGLVDDPFNLLFFVIGLILIYFKQNIYFLLLILASTFNKETAWILVFLYFIHNLQFVTRRNWWVIFGKTAIFSLTFIAVSLFKIILKPIKSIDETFVIYNFSCEQCVLHAFLILNIFWLSAIFFREQPKELKFFTRLSLITPFFIAWHYFGLIREIRFFVILGLILVPIGVGLLFPESLKKMEGESN